MKSNFYGDLSPNQDGVVATDVGDNDVVDKASKLPVIEGPDSFPVKQNELSDLEKKIFSTQAKRKFENISFLVVNAKTRTVIKSFNATESRPLASVTKITTALAALENVRDVSYARISHMLKTSNNAYASQYVRLAAKAIDGTQVGGKPFTATHSCPDSVAIETPASQAVFRWYKKQRPDVYWTGADLRDGAGCSHENVMTPVQMVHILEFADSFGKSFAGKSFADLLSIAGVEGTWAGRNTESKGMIFAKTGTLSVASNLAGFFYVKRGDVLYEYYFAIFIEKIGGSPSSSASRNMIELLVRNWIKQLAKNEVVLAGHL